MSDEATGAPKDPAKARKDRRVKIAFLAVTVIAVALVYYNQRNPPVLPLWSEDLSGSLRAAEAQKRKVIVLFLPAVLGEADRRWLVGNTIEKNEGRIDKGQFLRVKIAVSADVDIAPVRDYGIKEVPTILMLGPDGKEVKRLQGSQGRIAETDFTTFLVEANSPTR
jgi:hypothetical protein